MSFDKEKNFVSAVVYADSSRQANRFFLSELLKVLEENFAKYEIIVVNDGLGDDISRQAEAFCRENPSKCLTVLSSGPVQGVENAMTAGVDMAIGDFVFEFDSVRADFDFSMIMDVYRRCLDGNDVVFAVPTSGKKTSSRLFYRLFNRFSAYPYKIRTHRFSIISRRGINRVRSIGARTVYRKAIYASRGLPVGEIEYSPRRGGFPALSQRARGGDRADLAANSLILFTDIAYKGSIRLCLVMAFFLAAAAVYTVAVFLSGDPVAGWTTTMLVTSAGFFGLFVMLAAVMKYLSLILRLLFSKKQYLIEKVEKIVK